MLEVFDLELFAAVTEIDNIASRTRRREGRDLVEWELTLDKNVQDFASDIARRTDNRDPITHFIRSCNSIALHLSQAGRESDMAPLLARARGTCADRRSC